MNVSVPASSLTTALDAVASAGIPLAGSTIRLQLDGSGFDSAITHLQVSPSESARTVHILKSQLLVDSYQLTGTSRVRIDSKG